MGLWGAPRLRVAIGDQGLLISRSRVRGLNVVRIADPRAKIKGACESWTLEIADRAVLLLLSPTALNARIL